MNTRENLTVDEISPRRPQDPPWRSARLAGLEQVGAEVDSLASSGLREFPGALRDLAAAVAAVRVKAQGWDVSVAELVAAATDLDVQAPAPGGPRKSSAFLAVKGDTIQHRHTQLRPIGARLSRVLEHAVADELDEALAAAGIVGELPAPRRLDRPAAPGFPEKVRSAALAAAETDPGRFRLAEHLPEAPRQWTLEDVERAGPSDVVNAAEAGLLRDLGYAPARRGRG